MTLINPKSTTKGQTFRARLFQLCAVVLLGVFVVFWVRELSYDLNETFDVVSDTLSIPDDTTTAVSTGLTSTYEQQDFKVVAGKTGTDKVAAYKYLPDCLKDNKQCTRGGAEREACRPWGHFYDTIYNRWLGKYSTKTADPIQFLEIGYYNGKGFEAYTNYLPSAELHSMEISCIEPGPRNEGKWPWGNFGEKHRMYKGLRENDRLHCGDANEYDFLHHTWTTKMKRPDAPPLMVVVDDGSHLSQHMATSLFFWFPRIQPGGILVVEDIQPISEANQFRTHIVPQIMKDLHWCGGTAGVKDKLCFPTIQPLLAGVHCEMHICVFVRNDIPAYEPDKAASLTPANAFSGAKDCLFPPTL